RPRPTQGNARRPRGSEAMNFAFTDDQILLRNSVRAALDEQCKPAHVRAMMEDSKGYGETLWGEMAKLGWLGLPFAEEYGGAGPGARPGGPLALPRGSALARRLAPAHGGHRSRHPLVRDEARGRDGEAGRRGRSARRRRLAAGGAPPPRGGLRLGRDAGGRPPLSGHERGVREGARAVRPAHRLLPGHPSPLRGHADGGGERARGRVL